MKGFGVLLALASVSLLLFLGPPALASGAQQNYLSLQIASLMVTDVADAGPFDLAETPDAGPAGLQVVPDPGSCSGLSEAVACRPLNILRAARPRNILRQGVRLLNFLPCC